MFFNRWTGLLGSLVNGKREKRLTCELLDQRIPWVTVDVAGTRKTGTSMHLTTTDAKASNIDEPCRNENLLLLWGVVGKRTFLHLSQWSLNTAFYWINLLQLTPPSTRSAPPPACLVLHPCALVAGHAPWLKKYIGPGPTRGGSWTPLNLQGQCEECVARRPATRLKATAVLPELVQATFTRSSERSWGEVQGRMVLRALKKKRRTRRADAGGRWVPNQIQQSASLLISLTSYSLYVVSRCTNRKLFLMSPYPQDHSAILSNCSTKQFSAPAEPRDLLPAGVEVFLHHRCSGWAASQ